MKTKTILQLLFFFFSISMQAQRDTVNINGEIHCSRDIFDIIKKDNKTFYFFLPEDFISDSINYKVDSTYVYLENHKYLQQTYSSKKLKFKILVDQEKKSLYVENLISKKKAKIDFIESCEIIFTGTKYYYEDKNLRYFFKAKFDGYEQDFSLRFAKFRNKKVIVLNEGHPQYKKCAP